MPLNIGLYVMITQCKFGVGENLTKFVVDTLMQSFVVALLTIVVATFSTGIDSQCFQVGIFLEIFPYLVEDKSY